MCAQHSWHALGGDKGCPPAWGTPHANAVYDKVKKSGRWFTSDPPRGALILWKYGKHGHAALSMGGGKIATTDPSSNPNGGVGVEPITYPHRWGATTKARIWTDQYNGVRFTTGATNVTNYDYKYLGKPSGTLTVGTKYVKLDKSTWTPPRKGWESTLVYLNVTPTFKTGKSTGALRIRIVRSDGDKTAYNDVPISKDTLEDGSTLITYTYWELGEAGTKGKTHVELRCHGGLASVKIGTRYRKVCTVVK